MLPKASHAQLKYSIISKMEPPTMTFYVLKTSQRNLYTIIDENFQITTTIEDALNFPPDDNVNTKSEISDDNCTNKAASQFNITDVTTPFSNSISTPRSHTDSLKKINTRFLSLEDKSNSMEI